MTKTLTWQPPLHHTRPLYDRTRGPEVYGWVEDSFTVLKGPLAGQPMRWLAWEKYVAEQLYELTPQGTHRYREGLVGVGRQNGKSLVGSGLALEALFRGPIGSEVYSAAGDRQQARIVFNEARRQVEQSPALSKHANIFRDAIEIPAKGSVYRVLSSDAKLQQGLSPYFCLFDEVHVQRDEELWNAMRFGMAARPDAILLGITTAGDHEDSLCGRLYEYGKKLAAKEIEDSTFFFAWWEPENEAVATDDRVGWAQANPALAEGMLDYDELASAEMKSTPSAFRRYRLNQWTGHGGSRWMDMAAWDACANTRIKFKKRAPVVLAFDGSVDDDATALSVIRCDLEVPALVKTFVWERREGDPEGWKVDRADVDATVEMLFADYRVLAMGCDPAYWRSEIEGWQQRFGGRKVLEWPVTDSRMGPAVTETYKRVKEGTFKHIADPVVRRHVKNAVTKNVRGDHVTIRKQTPKSVFKIDAAVTVCIGVDLWLRYAKRNRTMKSA